MAAKRQQAAAVERHTTDSLDNHNSPRSLSLPALGMLSWIVPRLGRREVK